MNANELKIGNWISHDKLGTIYINGISPHCGDFKINNVFEWVYLKNCEPIPITEEIFLKFGFKLITLKTKKYMIKDLYNEPCFFLNKDNSIRYQNTLIKHVHQLQNLYFALTGEELQYEVRG